MFLLHLLDHQLYALRYIHPLNEMKSVVYHFEVTWRLAQVQSVCIVMGYLGENLASLIGSHWAKPHSLNRPTEKFDRTPTDPSTSAATSAFEWPLRELGVDNSFMNVIIFFFSPVIRHQCN